MIEYHFVRGQSGNRVRQNRTHSKTRVIAGWSSPVARRAHNPKVSGSNPLPATIWKNRGKVFKLYLYFFLSVWNANAPDIKIICLTRRFFAYAQNDDFCFLRPLGEQGRISTWVFTKVRNSGEGLLVKFAKHFIAPLLSCGHPPPKGWRKMNL